MYLVYKNQSIHKIIIRRAFSGYLLFCVMSHFYLRYQIKYKFAKATLMDSGRESQAWLSRSNPSNNQIKKPMPKARAFLFGG